MELSDTRKLSDDEQEASVPVLFYLVFLFPLFELLESYSEALCTNFDISWIIFLDVEKVSKVCYMIPHYYYLLYMFYYILSMRCEFYDRFRCVYLL